SRKLCADNPRCESFGYPSSSLPVPLPGRHNQWNAAAAMAVAGIWKSPDEILKSLARIKPVRRRFETVWENRGIRIISDYAHHPTEIAALIQTARELKPARLLGVFQPHRYTRTLALGQDFPASFEGLDHLWLVPVYAASEQPVEGGTTEDLANRFSREWNARITRCLSLAAAWSDIRSQLHPGDMLLVIGAGDIEQLADWAKEL
ncbi:MAG TPA: cyanophycin synthetase, partial [Pontiella sp.]|nr:cyanophycin synthetase [Pontiella sp.]